MKEIQDVFCKMAVVAVLVLAGPMGHAVSEDAEEESAGPGPIEMQEIMQAHVTGGQLYRKKKYSEAIEHLEVAAKGGQKRSQAQLSAIYLYGLGDLPRDTKKAVGWLGVAAHGETDPAYKKEYDKVYKAIAKAQQPMIDKLVDVYVANYGAEATHTSCKLTRRAGTRMSRLVCSFDDLHKYRDQLNAETFGALSAEGQITDYNENYRSAGFGGTGGSTGGGGGGGGGGPGGF